MAISITWQAPRPSGVRMCAFRHNGQSVEMKAAVCVQNTWTGEPDSAEWLIDRDAWAQEHAQAIIDRRDYEASPARRRAAAQEEYDREQDEIDRATERRAELKVEYPDLTEGVG